MTVKSRAVTVGTDPTRLDTAGENPNQAAQGLSVFNNSAVTIWIGGPDVTVAAGTPVLAGEHYPIGGLGFGEGTYGCVATGTAEARILETGIPT